LENIKHKMGSRHHLALLDKHLNFDIIEEYFPLKREMEEHEKEIFSFYKGKVNHTTLDYITFLTACKYGCIKFLQAQK